MTDQFIQPTIAATFRADNRMLRFVGRAVLESSVGMQAQYIGYHVVERSYGAIYDVVVGGGVVVIVVFVIVVVMFVCASR